jgi:hypothetical protein
MSFTIGADPEVFLERNNIPVSSIGKIGGTKYEPIHIQDGIFLQEDNVTVEYNIPPCKTLEDFIIYNQRALDIIAEKANKLDLKVAIQAAAKMPKEELQDPRAWVFGCEPDFNVWKMEENPKPKPTQWRAAGGHIHIGYECSNLEKIQLTKYLDNTLGAIFSVLDPDTKRKKMYGTAGSIRFKPYGIEYRTLSNYWLRHPFLIATVYETVKHGITFIEKGQNPSLPLPNKTLEAINKRKVKEILEYINHVLLNTTIFPAIIRSLLSKTNYALIKTDKGLDIDQEVFFKLLDKEEKVPSKGTLSDLLQQKIYA